MTRFQIIICILFPIACSGQLKGDSLINKLNGTWTYKDSATTSKVLFSHTGFILNDSLFVCDIHVCQSKTRRMVDTYRKLAINKPIQVRHGLKKRYHFTIIIVDDKKLILNAPADLKTDSNYITRTYLKTAGPIK